MIIMEIRWCKMVLLMIVISLAVLAVADTTNEPSAACRQAKASGFCGGKYLRYAYNEQTGNCISFIYTGCGATDNNFLTFEECRRDCMMKQRY